MIPALSMPAGSVWVAPGTSDWVNLKVSGAASAFQRQAGLGPVQSLNLALLVHAISVKNRPGTILQGHENRRRNLLQRLLPGDVFGLGTLLKHPPAYIGSGQTISDCELLVWEHTKIRKLANTYPQLAENGLRIVLHYLKGYADRHVGLITKTSKQRLAETLLNLGHRTGRVHRHGIEIEATNEQLSALADISRFTTSRLLSGWEREGAVSKTRGRVLVHTPETLIIE
jgi:CRP-like cAMP-binding protein